MSPTLSRPWSFPQLYFIPYPDGGSTPDILEALSPVVGEINFRLGLPTLDAELNMAPRGAEQDKRDKLVQHDYAGYDDSMRSCSWRIGLVAGLSRFNGLQNDSRAAILLRGAILLLR